MSTLCLSDMGELRDEWLREPRPAALAAAPPREASPPAEVAPGLLAFAADNQAVAA